MAKICYQEKDFRPASLAMIFKCNEIITAYQQAGYDLTLRQLYYQLVSRDLIPNKQTEYDKLGSLVNDARLAGLIDWDAIEDRTRNVRSLPHWETPNEIIDSCAAQYRIDLWADQPHRVEVWIEKDALVGVIARICDQLDVPYFSCRGYTSQSEMWRAGQRIVQRYEDDEQETIILHLGDHDPSGIDMTRDIEDRLQMFCDHHDAPAPEIKRLALNMNQVRQYNPPPNPAKITDSRANGYIARHGRVSWELDALTPEVLTGLIRDNVMQVIDEDKYTARQREITQARAGLKAVSKKWDEVVAAIEGGTL